MNPTYAILLDGGFVTKILERKLKRFPNASDIDAECDRINNNPALTNHDLLRIYFYDAMPSNAVLQNPIDGTRLNLATTPVYGQHESLLDTLELRPNVALRKGETLVHGWRLGGQALRSMRQNPRPVTPQDFVPNIQQKGVDLRIGLDIARLALRQMVRTIVVVTGDSDLVPAFTFARREGLRVYLDCLGTAQRVRRELKAHTDLILG